MPAQACEFGGCRGLCDTVLSMFVNSLMRHRARWGGRMPALASASMAALMHAPSTLPSTCSTCTLTPICALGNRSSRMVCSRALRIVLASSVVFLSPRPRLCLRFPVPTPKDCPGECPLLDGLTQAHNRARPKARTGAYSASR